MAISVKLCLFGAVTYLCCTFRLTAGSRTVGDPEMLAAGSTGMIKTKPFEMTEKGTTYCPNNPNRRFRSIDGTCNNLMNKGAADLPLARLVLPPLYENGTLGKLRTRGPSGQPLPSPRVVSSLVHPENTRNQGLNVIFMQWGQFIDHDVGLSPQPTEGGNRIVCCGEGNVGIADPLPVECEPIRFPSPDEDFNGDCMEFVRSDEAKEDYGVATESKFREQLNAVTAFVDASMVYGSEEELAKELRTRNGTGAFLNATLDPKEGQLLPQSDENCRLVNPGDFCFQAGDIRVNEQPGLVTIHTIFLRLHNLVANNILWRQPALSPEEVYQRARKLVGAIVQNIHYGEWLPILLGPRTMQRYRLATGERTAYVAAVDPSILQEFSTAAFRMGHSLVPNFLLAGNRALRLRDHFLLPGIVAEAFNDIAEGLVNGTATVTNLESGRIEVNQAQVLDQFISEELNAHLFEVKPRKGLDLISLNIQRGRDHGLPTYNQVRRACGFSPVTSFDSPVFNGSALRGVYADVEDIDLFPASLLEPSLDGGLLGRTFSCIIATQFFRLKFGDRFFFETNQRPEGFFPASSLDAVRGITMSTVLCVTTRIRMLPQNAFRAVSSTRNPMMDCVDMRNSWSTTMNTLYN